MARRRSSGGGRCPLFPAVGPWSAEPAVGSQPGRLTIRPTALFAPTVQVWPVWRVPMQVPPGSVRTNRSLDHRSPKQGRWSARGRRRSVLGSLRQLALTRHFAVRRCRGRMLPLSGAQRRPQRRKAPALDTADASRQLRRRCRPTASDTEAGTHGTDRRPFSALAGPTPARWQLQARVSSSGTGP